MKKTFEEKEVTMGNVMKAILSEQYEWVLVWKRKPKTNILTGIAFSARSVENIDHIIGADMVVLTDENIFDTATQLAEETTEKKRALERRAEELAELTEVINNKLQNIVVFDKKISVF